MKAPFNFVPLSEEVFFPDWAEEISHDIPFSDGRSGILRLKITAKTPIFVRNGHTREDKEYWTDDYKSFCHTPDGRFFIPATSLKGMVRNILEIASFGKMSHITNKRYSLRDLHLKAYLEYFRTHEVRCGWMRIDRSKGEAVVEDHGIPGRISAKDVDEMLGLYGNQSLENFVKEGNLRTEKNRSAVYKYKQIVKNCNLHGQFVRIQNENDVDPRKKYRSSSNGEPGVVVLTGQPGKRQEKRGRSTGKFYEFIFFDKEYGQLTLDINQENGVYDDFCFIYQDSDDWKYWKNKDRIPVFFTVEDGHISYMGLSYLFKLPFKKHLKDFLNKKHLDAKLDLAECIFGTVEGDALKGRVQFSHAFCRNPKVGDILYPYMGSPKPTYYPIYTQQNGKNGMMFDGHRMLKYKTFLDDDAKLRGWKRYPVREAPSRISEPIPGQEENTSPFEPLDAGCEFLFTVRYHNLREKELAALVFALNVSEKCLYSLGFCKPYGYGVVKMEILDMNEEERKVQRKIFTDMMEKNITGYMNSPQIRELEVMMTIPNTTLLEPLEYIPDPKMFASLKNQNARNEQYGEYQRNYSELLRPTPPQQHTLQVERELVATVSFKEHGMIKAKLNSGESLKVDLEGNPIRLNIGDKIKVRKFRKGGMQVLLYLGKA